MKRFLITLLLLCACKKQLDLQQGDVKIRYLSLDYIKAYINGRWRANYQIGGLTGVSKYYYNNSFVSFDNSDQMVWTINDSVFVNCRINWVYANDANSQKTYFMFFSDKSGRSLHWVVDQIYQDTLYMDDNNLDGFKILLSRK